MKTAIFLSTREKAKRLPKKVILKIKGRTVTEHLIDRLKTAKLPEQIILCTSTNPRDTVLIDIARKNGIEYFRGSEDDRLERHLNAAKKFGIDFMATVDGDDIFCDPEYIDKSIEKFKETNADYITCEELPLGVTSLGVKYEALEKICQLKDETDTARWGEFFTDTGLFKVVYLKVEDRELKHPEYRMTLDYKEDFEFFKAVFDKLYIPGKVFTLRQIVQLLKREPWIVKINSDVQRLWEKKREGELRKVWQKKK